jgi:hypothetical protein
MNSNLMKLFQGLATALLLVLVAGCSSTTTEGGAAGPRPSGTFTVRANQVLRLSTGGSGEGTLIFQGWQYRFQADRMILSGMGGQEVELEGTVYNLEKVEDFEGTYKAVAADMKEGEGLQGLWVENEKGVSVHILSRGQDLTIRLKAEGSIVTLK